MTHAENFILWLAKEQLGLEWSGKKNVLNEYIMYTADGGREPYSLEALKKDLFPISR